MASLLARNPALLLSCLGLLFQHVRTSSWGGRGWGGSDAIDNELELSGGGVEQVRSQDVIMRWNTGINESTSRFESWKAEDPIDIWYLKKIFVKWYIPERERLYILYHSSVGFTNNATGEEAYFEFVPREAEDSIYILLPWFSLDIWIPKWKLEKLPFTWDRRAYVKYYDAIPPNLTRKVRIARTRGAALHEYAKWLHEANIPDTFDPFGVVVQDAREHYSSYSCMEFVDHSLRTLHSNGVDIKFDTDISKDVNLFYAARATKLGDISTCARCGREMMRSGRLYQLVLQRTTSWSYHLFRGKLSLFFKAGLPIIAANPQTTMMRVELAPPFNNHCKLLVVHPSQDYDVFNPSFCALPVNITTLPSEHFTFLEAIIVAEERLDRPAAFIAFIMMAIIASCPFI